MKNNQKNKIMAHLVAGFPTLSDSLKLAKTLSTSGADILEIQIPFSEPVADGQIIVEACHIALKKGFQTKQIFDFCDQVSRYKTPIVVMTYANPLLSIGIKEFCEKLSKVKVSGIIVPDLPFDSKEGVLLKKYSLEFNIDLIQVVSPSMNKDRLKKSIDSSNKMIYCTTKSGTTGGKISVSKTFKDTVQEIRKSSNLSIAAGFGISSKKDVEVMSKLVDVIVIGSAIIRIYNKSPKKDRFLKVSKFVRELNRV